MPFIQCDLGHGLRHEESRLVVMRDGYWKVFGIASLTVYSF